MIFFDLFLQSLQLSDREQGVLCPVQVFDQYKFMPQVMVAKVVLFWLVKIKYINSLLLSSPITPALPMPSLVRSIRKLWTLNCRLYGVPENWACQTYRLLPASMFQ